MIRPETLLEGVARRIVITEKELKRLERLKELLSNNKEIEEILMLLGKHL